MATHTAIFEVHVRTEGAPETVEGLMERVRMALAAEFEPGRSAHDTSNVAVNFVGCSFRSER